MSTKLCILLLGLLFSSINPIQAQGSKTRIELDAQAKGIQLPPSPWHLTDIWWDFETPKSKFHRLDIDFQLNRNVSKEVNLYIAPLGLAQLNGIKCYGGIQTHIGGFPNKTSRQRVSKGKGGIFSRWSSNPNKPIGLDYVDLFPDGFCESNGYEGEFCSVRRPYAWKAGRYTLSLLKEETIIYKNTPHTWFSLNILSHQSKKTFKIGRLLFEGKTFTLNKNYAAFVEVYGHSDIPEVTITFDVPRINGKTPSSIHATAHRPTRNGAAPNCAEVKSTAQKQISVKIAPVLRNQEFSSIHLY